MNNNLNKSVLNGILEKIPENIKPVNYFMDILDVGKESAYRRLRGEKPLSLDEIHKLCVDLDFSLDEIIGNKNTNTFTFNYIGTSEENPDNNVLEFLLFYENYLKHVLSHENAEIINTMSNLLSTLFVGFDELFKFIYYHWMHQMKEVPFNYRYVDLVVPPKIKTACDNINDLHKELKKVTMIIDKNIHLNLIKEMQYFYVRGLIGEAELAKLKEQYLRYMDHTEKIITKGVGPNGGSYEIYLSMLSISSSTSYITWGDNKESAFWHNSCYPMHTRNREITDRHKHWIDSLKKYSSLITHSNELLQADFFNEQRNYVNNIGDKILL